MNLKEQIGRIQEMMGINEIRDKFYEFLRKDNPNVPPYIVNDVFYKTMKNHEDEWFTPGTDANDYYVNVLQKYEWELKKNFPITMDMFDEESQERLKERIEMFAKGSGEEHIPKDIERHQKQQELLQSRGLPTEPIVIAVSPDEPGKYGLWEGWHRTIQAFIKYPEGFRYPNVYIASK
jgi:hypothetical protein